VFVLLFELVGGVEGRHGDVDDFQVTDGAVDASGSDHDGGQGFERNDFAIRFEVAFSFKDDVHLGHAFVMVGAAVGVDVGEVDGRGSIGDFGEGAASFAAGAWDGRQGVELGNVKAFHGRWKRSGSWSGASSRGWKMKLVE
jgi:hypothetical protein